MIIKKAGDKTAAEKYAEARAYLELVYTNKLLSEQWDGELTKWGMKRPADEAHIEACTIGVEEAYKNHCNDVVVKDFTEKVLMPYLAENPYFKEGENIELADSFLE